MFKLQSLTLTAHRHTFFAQYVQLLDDNGSPVDANTCFGRMQVRHAAGDVGDPYLALRDDLLTDNGSGLIAQDDGRWLIAINQLDIDALPAASPASATLVLAWDLLAVATGDLGPSKAFSGAFDLVATVTTDLPPGSELDFSDRNESGLQPAL